MTGWHSGWLLLIPTLGFCCGCASLESTSTGQGYGAVAYAASTQDWRLRWQAADPQQARQQVLQDCAAADCQVVLEFGPGQCGTLALGSRGIGIGQGATPDAAESAARAACQQQGSGCRVATAECNR
ncbi:MAG TPA: DUF4189 domain-containing protein [Candidatus Competibacteraceae bacterium]|nr:MAG: DUF4189 domain-containing protein [Candidatus Competibacteraceae bacterium]HQC71490.1 DUF4189 domain-containing protein [Candidatus Competibacteraceae bacterium]